MAVHRPVIERRRRGRPRIGARVEVRIPNDLFNELWRESRRRDVPIAEIIRERITAVDKSQTVQPSVS